MRPLLLLSAACLTSCVGYQLGGVKPKSLAKVQTIAVPMFANDTQHPRAEALATSAVTSAFTQDGTYRIASREKADAVLEGHVRRIDYTQLRANRLDTLRPE
ncbi:MAG TPA: LPS assembly lipoprotein LptE, partial [Luteolibacter sp.]